MLMILQICCSYYKNIRTNCQLLNLIFTKLLQTDSMSLEWEKNKKIVSNDDDKLSIYGVYSIKKNE